MQKRNWLVIAEAYSQEVFDDAVMIAYFLTVIAMVAASVIINNWLFIDGGELVDLDLVIASLDVLRKSGIVVGILVLIRWVRKRPVPVSWFSIGIGCAGFSLALAAQALWARIFQDPFWNWEITTAISFLLWFVALGCWTAWIFNPKPQQRKTSTTSTKEG